MTFVRKSSMQDAHEDFKLHNTGYEQIKCYNIATMIYCVWYQYYPYSNIAMIKLTHLAYSSATGFSYIEFDKFAYTPKTSRRNFEKWLKNSMYVHAVNYLRTTCPLGEESQKVFLDKLRKSVL